MERLTKYMNKNDPSRASSAARDYACFHKRLGKKLLFVYDLVGCDSTFLMIEKHSERPPVQIDFWYGIYE